MTYFVRYPNLPPPNNTKHDDNCFTFLADNSAGLYRNFRLPMDVCFHNIFFLSELRASTWDLLMGSGGFMGLTGRCEETSVSWQNELIGAEKNDMRRTMIKRSASFILDVVLWRVLRWSYGCGCCSCSCSCCWWWWFEISDPSSVFSGSYRAGQFLWIR